LPFFLAAKIEACHGRGQGDFRLSSDFEDIVTVIAGQKDLWQLSEAPESVRAYLRKNFRAFIGDPQFLEALSAHLDPGSTRQKVAEGTIERINGFLAVG
jgi:hypothetical protein